jgi:hypothetical protein
MGPMRHRGPIRPPAHKSYHFGGTSCSSVGIQLFPSRIAALGPHTDTRVYGVPEGVARGVVEGLTSSFTAALGEATGVGVAGGVTDETGLAEVSGVVDDCGVTFAAGVLEAFAVGLATPVVALGTALVLGATVTVGAGLAFFSSFSSRPRGLSELCLATKIVRSRVTPKNIPPR